MRPSILASGYLWSGSRPAQLIHSCQNAKRLRNGKLEIDMPFFGDSPLREGWRTEGETCLDENQWCLRDSPYRFLFLVQNAKELASRVRELGKPASERV